jgi:hypothetical protein
MRELTDDTTGDDRSGWDNQSVQGRGDASSETDSVANRQLLASPLPRMRGPRARNSQRAWPFAAGGPTS